MNLIQKLKEQAREGDIRAILKLKKIMREEATEQLHTKRDTMPLPTQAQYETNELSVARRDEERINQEPLQDRKECQANFLEDMATDPALVAERIAWLIDGNYGYGQMILAKRIVASPRSNRVAALSQLVGVFEWHCPRAMGVAAWKKMTKAKQQALESAIETVISEAEKAE
jgi:hypothetical protein